MSEPIQKSLLTYICSDEGHNFQPLETDGGRGYYKRDENDVAIKDKVYKMTLCPKCGETKEIIVRDNTVPAPVKTKTKRGRVK